MTWFVFARVLFVAAVAYSASLVRPVHELALVNVLFGAGLAGLVVVFEAQLRDTAVSSILGAVIGGTFGLSIAKTDHHDAVLGRHHRQPCRLPPHRHAARPDLPRAGRRWSQGRMARAGAPHQPVPRHGAQEALQDSRHQRHHRRPHRRHRRDRLPRRHPRDPAVRPAGTATGGRFRRLDEAQPRPPRPRHPPAHPEDGQPRRPHLARTTSPTSRSRPEADRAGQGARLQDRHQRLQPEQGGPAARRRSPQHQRTRQLR